MIGMPASIEQSTRALGFTVLTILVATFGTITVAAYGIGIRVLSVVFIPGMGLSIATSALVGQNIGAGKMARAEETNRIGSIIAFVTLTIAGAVLYFVARPLSLAFMPVGGEAIDQSAQFIRIIAFTFGLIGWQMVVTGTMRGAGDTKSSMILTLISQWLIQFPLAYLLSTYLEMGEVGIWWSFALSNILSTIVTVLWFMRGTWKKKNLLDDMALSGKVRDELTADEGTVS